MGIKLTPAVLPTNMRRQSFDITITSSIFPVETFALVPPGANSVIYSTTISRTDGLTDPDVTLSNVSATTVRMYGTYRYGFTDTATYVSAGQSNLTQTPTTVSGLENVPLHQNLYKVFSATNTLHIPIRVVVQYYQGSATGLSTTLSTTTVDLTHQVDPEFSGPYDFLRAYFP